MILGAPRGLGELAAAPAPASPSLLDSFLGVSPGYLKKKLEGIELLLFLSVAAGLSSALVTAIDRRRR